MKKAKLLLILFLGFIPVVASANSVHCSAPGSVESGQSFQVTFSGSLSGAGGIWLGQIGSEGNATYQGGNLSFGGEETQNFSRTITYKAGNPGQAVFYAYDVDAASDNDQISSSDRCTVTITEAKPSQNYSNNNSSNNYEEKSSNNNLKSLSIEGVTLSPEFNKDTLEYKGVVPGDKEKINIAAEAEDDKASVEGLGEKDLEEGVNKFEIKVRAENDEEKVYIIEITRKEKNPIEVIINKKKYTVFKKESNVEPPKGFVKTTVVIEKQDVVAYSNEYIDYILVLLVDEEGNSSWYIYNSKNSTYVKYTEVKSNDLRLVFIKPTKVPSNYIKTKIKLNNEEVEAYYIKGINEFKLVYAINMNNGDESFYQYDTEEKTFQRYNTKLLSSVEDFSKKLEICLVGAAALVLILIIIVIALLSSKRKMKKAIKNKKENEAIERIVKNEEKKEENPKEEKQEEKKLSKKELKKIKKEEKKRLKKESEDFLK